MKVGIKKLREEEWLVQVGFASIKMDHFALELLQMTLEHLVALEAGQQHSILKSYVKLTRRLVGLDDGGLQKLLRKVESSDLLLLILAANDASLNRKIFANLGGILSKQLQADLDRNVVAPEGEMVKDAIKRVLKTMFAMESSGEIEVFSSETKYI